MDIAAYSELFLNKLTSPSVCNIKLKWNLQDELDKLEQSLESIRSKSFADNNKSAKMLRDLFYDTQDILDEYEIYSLKSQLQGHHQNVSQVIHFFFTLNSFTFRVKMSYEMHRVVKRLHKIEMHGKPKTNVALAHSGLDVEEILGDMGFEQEPDGPRFSEDSPISIESTMSVIVMGFEQETVRTRVCGCGPSYISADLIDKKEPEGPHFSDDNPIYIETTLSEYCPSFSSRSPSIRAAGTRVSLERVKSRRLWSVSRKWDVIGRENDKERVVEALMECRNDLSVLPIVGVGGIGKSTLAKYVYNDVRIVKHFQLRIWVNLSPNFSVRKVIERIIQYASVNKRMIFRNYQMDELRNMVGDILHENVYLIILDGLWSKDVGKWNELKDFLVATASGSKIVVVTRDESIASVVGTMPMHCVKGLAHDDCLTLFLKSAFAGGEEEEHPNLVGIGVDIVQKCEGIPLSVILLGSSLHRRIKETEWAEVRDHSVWNSQQSGNVLPVLKVSYEKLPSYLKACLAYCSIFPKGCEIEINKLIQLWMAQGLIHVPTYDDELEDIGFNYFNELWLRSFFQDIDENGPFFTSTCKMNDLVHDFVLSVAGSDCTIVYSHTQNISEDVKHVAFSDYDLSAKELPISLLQNHALRTIFFPFDVVGPTVTSFVDNCVSRFMHLRTLDLSYSCFEILPSTIGELKHLKYLDLFGNGSIRTLPNSIGKLHCLNILRVALCTQLVELPKVTEDLISLRHLYLTTKQESFPDKGVGCLSSLRSLSLYSCKSLVSLSDELKCLRNLRSLTIVDCPKLTFLPSSLKYLTALENLYIIDCDELTLFEWQDIEGLNMIRSLFIGGLPQLGSRDVECLENLQSLVIIGLPQLAALPRWVEGSARTLRNLRIARCPNLLALPEWLKNLTALEKIEISECPKLTSLPAGMPCLVELWELKIDNCPELIRECGGKDRGNIAHIKDTYLDGILVQ